MQAQSHIICIDTLGRIISTRAFTSMLLRIDAHLHRRSNASITHSFASTLNHINRILIENEIDNDLNLMEISTWDPFVLKRSIRSFVSTPIHHTDTLDRISFVPISLVTSARSFTSIRYCLPQPYAPSHRRSIVSTAHSSASMPGLMDTLLFASTRSVISFASTVIHFYMLVRIDSQTH